MIIEHDPNVPALKREWLGARIVGALGALLLAAVIAIVTVSQLQMTAPEAVTSAAPEAVTPAAPAAPDPEAVRQESIALCNAALSTVQTLGLVPAFAVRDGDDAKPAGAQGRYVCGAKTDAATYAITFDLACSHLGGANCIVPFAIVQDGMKVLYQRK